MTRFSESSWEEEKTTETFLLSLIRPSVTIVWNVKNVKFQNNEEEDEHDKSTIISPYILAVFANIALFWIKVSIFKHWNMNS